MSWPRSTGAFCLALAMAATAATANGGADPTKEDLYERIRLLETRLAQVEQQHERDHWLTEQRANEIRGLVKDVLADADTRANLLGGGMTAGWDDGFFLASADGNYRLNIQGQLQFRHIYNYQSNPRDIVDQDGEFISSGDRHRSGFENARTQLIFTGNIVNPRWIYRVQGNFLRSGGRFELEEAFIGYALTDEWTFLAGQFRVPMLREFLVTEPRQQAVERSLIHQEFSAFRTQGVAVDYRNDFFHFTGGFTDGHPATGGFNTPALFRTTEFALTGRGEILLAGDWSQFNDFAGWRGDGFGALIGAAIHWQKDEFGTDDPVLEVLQWTVDAQLEFGGGNLFAYIVGRHLDHPGFTLDQYGFVVQGGYFLTDDWEVFARYEWGDDDIAGSKNLSVITFGVNHFIASHRIKWTTDVGIALREVSATWGDGFIGAGGGMAGWRTDQPGESGQVVVRSQLQLLF